ncbi:MAG TPA: PLDc N-terminal domain-containing protein [Candidatus Corynebacterium avicola]|uniref:PLDc N-terminal domain-containing protein n=1 Tax=Candidatus Corynebacterium avicola TaxID=2838527 RepID=A0A9D1RL62_9CORY|nr:PLDc N-terminal domain-containing protein [Candidatus Corynebacterium avicola]
MEGIAFILLVLMAAAVIAWLVMFLLALFEILKHRTITGGSKVVWIIISFACPVLGPILWFIWGRKGALGNL